jgi:DNA (cytosine-5)-methyltransferase 1
LNKYKYIDLFAGIGGFALGEHMAGVKFKEHYFSEIDNFCIELYKKRFPGAINLGDIRDINLKNNGDNWILTGGFPCQDISRSGKKEGIYGKKSILWFEYFRRIRELRPDFAIIENVGDIARRGLSTMLGNLASIGYDAEWTCISARDFGLPHNRERIWVIAYPEQSGWGRSLCVNIRDIYKTCKKANALDSQCNYFLQFEKRMGRPAVLGVDDGIPRRVDRLGAVGNSIIPDIARLFFLAIREVLND